MTGKTNILAFAGSNGPQSINQQLVTHAAGLLNENSSTLISLCDFPMPVFGVEMLEKEGAPENSKRFRELISKPLCSTGGI